jgi:hypothetical protein
VFAAPLWFNPQFFHPGTQGAGWETQAFRGTAGTGDPASAVFKDASDVLPLDRFQRFAARRPLLFEVFGVLPEVIHQFENGSRRGQHRAFDNIL